MTKEEKKILCRVCGKSFKPCSYCQSHADTFRWRNFACSKECAEKYIAEAEAYRASLHKKDKIVQEVLEETNATNEDSVQEVLVKKTSRRKAENIDENRVID